MREAWISEPVDGVDVMRFRQAWRGRFPTEPGVEEPWARPLADAGVFAHRELDYDRSVFVVPKPERAATPNWDVWELVQALVSCEVDRVQAALRTLGIEP